MWNVFKKFFPPPPSPRAKYDVLKDMRGDLLRGFGIHGHGIYGLSFLSPEQESPEIMFRCTELENLPPIIHNASFVFPDLADIAYFAERVRSPEIDLTRVCVVMGDEGRFYIYAKFLYRPVLESDKEMFYKLLSDDAKEIMDSYRR